MRDFKDIKIAVAGTGYVGLSIATLLSQHHHVTAVDVIPEKVEKLNNKISPIQDENIDYNLNFTFNKAQKRTVRAALSNTFGFGGHNACVIFKKYDD